MADKKTCKIPVGSSPSEVLLYEFTRKYIFFYEIDCLIQDVVPKKDGALLKIDCLKAGHSRKFEEVDVSVTAKDRLVVNFSKTWPGPETLYRCPNEPQSKRSRHWKLSQWSHNGSVMQLSDNGYSLQIDYLNPRKGLHPAGVRPESLLFLGTRDGEKIEGKAWQFNRDCGPLEFAVEGQFSNDEKRITLSGSPPKVNEKCEKTSSPQEILIFDRLKRPRKTAAPASNG